MSVEALRDQSRMHRRVLREVSIAVRCAETASLHTEGLVDEGVLLVVRVRSRPYQLHLQLFVRGRQQTTICSQVGQAGGRRLRVIGDLGEFTRSKPIVRLDSPAQVMIETCVDD